MEFGGCPNEYLSMSVFFLNFQVQRCADDMSILITTYEGTHNHPLPMSATAMASTTSAAASMLQSCSSSSQGLGTSTTAPISTFTTTNLHELNFPLSQTSRPQRFYMPNSSISTCNSHPTVTLDLTTAPSTSSSSFGRFSSSFSSTPRYPSTSLNFSSPSLFSLEPNSLQGNCNGYTSYHNYGTSTNKQNPIGDSYTGKQPFQEHLHQTYMNSQNASQQPFKESIVSATKAITSNPKFQSVLAAAFTSYVGNGGGEARENKGIIESSNLKSKWGESRMDVNPIYQSSQNGMGCASSFLNKSQTLNSPQQGGLTLFPPSLQVSTSKRGSAAPADHRGHFKL